MPINSHADEEYSKVLKQYSSSSMNNSKWFKLLTAMAASGIEIEQCQWKCIGDGICFWASLPKVKDLLPNRFEDGRYQPFEYKWIEWMHIPHQFQRKKDVSFYVKQDTIGLKTLIDSVGQFDVEYDSEGIRVYAYRV